MIERLRASALLPFLAVILGLIVGALLILVAGKNPWVAYSAMVEGAFFGGNAFGRTLEKATPLIMGGLAVAVAFKAGLFNIGGQGQLLLGAAFAAWAGFTFDLPMIVHIPVALIVGGLVAALIGAIVGGLKAYRGTHEVITTIMLNFVLGNFTDWLASRDGPWNDPEGGALARTPLIADSAQIPRVGGLPTGFLVAVGLAVLCWWLIERSTFGFEIKTAGLNKNAATYAGIGVNKILILTMAISAFLAGVGGAIETQGVTNRFEPGFNTGLGFDGITIALLARTNPLAVVPAALLFGAMDAGSSLMQSQARIAPEIIAVIQAAILFFIAAPTVVQYITRARNVSSEDDGVRLSAGWGG